MASLKNPKPRVRCSDLRSRFQSILFLILVIKGAYLILESLLLIISHDVALVSRITKDLIINEPVSFDQTGLN